MKKIVRLTEGDLHRIIENSARRILSELDWKTYANAAKKRHSQLKDDPHNSKLFDKYYELNDMANKRFNDDYVGNMKYDSFGDKSKGKHSPKFDARFNVSKEDRMPYGAINGYNKSGNKIFSTDKGTYHSYDGITTPSKFFRDKEVADKFTKANDELWNYDNGNYEYQKGKGYQLKESYYDGEMDPYDWDKSMENGYFSRADKAYDDIYDGHYDDKIESWYNGDRDPYDDLDLDIDMGASGIWDAIKDRYYVLNKDAAFKHGVNPSDYPKGLKDYDMSYPRHENKNVKVRKHRPESLSNDAWDVMDKQNATKMFPNSFNKKTGGFKKGNLADLISKDIVGTDQFNKRPLHRKGSLNREL